MGVETDTLPRTVERKNARAVVKTVVGSLALAIVLSLVVNGSAFAALHVSSAPMVVSLLVEPVSLLLLPSAVMMTSLSGGDVEGGQILWGSLGFYAAFFFALLCWMKLRRQA